MARFVTGRPPDTHYLYPSPEDRKRRKERTDKRWAARSGPVVIVKPASTLGRKPGPPKA